MVKIYYLLKKNKIIFTKPKLLVNHLIRINQDPLIWWNNNKTLKARVHSKTIQKVEVLNIGANTLARLIKTICYYFEK